MKSLLKKKLNREFQAFMNNKAYNFFEALHIYLDRIYSKLQATVSVWGEKSKFRVALISLCSRYEQLLLSFLFYHFSPLQIQKR